MWFENVWNYKKLCTTHIFCWLYPWKSNRCKCTYYIITRQLFKYHDILFDRTECVAFMFVNQVGSFVQQREYIIHYCSNLSFINTNIRRSIVRSKKKNAARKENSISERCIHNVIGNFREKNMAKFLIIIIVRVRFVTERLK